MTVEVPLTQGFVALIDDEDAERVALRKWCAQRGNTGGYYAISPRQWRARVPAVLLHRYILEAPQGVKVDHIDQNPMNCRRENLRLATQSQNGCNRGKQANNTSGFKGVYWHREGKKWYVKIKARGENHYRGMFVDPAEAARVYDSLARELHGEFACLNFGDTP